MDSQRFWKVEWHMKFRVLGVSSAIPDRRFDIFPLAFWNTTKNHNPLDNISKHAWEAPAIFAGRSSTPQETKWHCRSWKHCTSTGENRLSTPERNIDKGNWPSEFELSRTMVRLSEIMSFNVSIIWLYVFSIYAKASFRLCIRLDKLFNHKSCIFL